MYHKFIGDILKDANTQSDIHSSNPERNPLLRPESVDSPLTETGIKQSVTRWPEAALLKHEVIVVSPLHHAIKTARISVADHVPTEQK